MCTGANRVGLPQADQPQPMEEDEDDIPQSLYVCNSRDAINFKIVFTANDLKPDRAQRSFKPELVFQIFGNSETIFGYRNLSINIYFMANSAKCFVDLKYNAIAKSTNGPPPDDIMQKLAAWLPEKYDMDKKQFRRVIAKENHAKKFGQMVDEFEAYNKREETTYKYIITQCSASEPGFSEFHSRFQCLIVWYIDAASQIDVDDSNWMFLYVYERRKKPNGRRYGYYPVGYCTVYKFFHFPDKVRARISQVFILPPCQGAGIGMKLLNAAYKMIYELPNVIDITVEDPCDAFTCMRDVLDCQLLMQLDNFRYPAISNGFTKQMFDEANKHFKLNKRQCRHAYNVLRMAYIFIQRDLGGFQRLYKEIEAHIEGPYVREQDAVQRKKIILSRRLTRDDTCIYQPVHSNKDLTRNADVYFQQVKMSAQRLCTRMKK